MNDEGERAVMRKAYLAVREKYSQKQFMARLKKAVKKSNVNEVFGMYEYDETRRMRKNTNIILY